MIHGVAVAGRSHRRHVDIAFDSRALGRVDNVARRQVVHPLERNALRPLFGDDPDQVDNGVHGPVLQCFVQRSRIEDVALGRFETIGGIQVRGHGAEFFGAVGLGIAHQGAQLQARGLQDGLRDDLTDKSGRSGDENLHECLSCWGGIWSSSREIY